MFNLFPIKGTWKVSLLYTKVSKNFDPSIHKYAIYLIFIEYILCVALHRKQWGSAYHKAHNPVVWLRFEIKQIKIWNLADKDAEDWELCNLKSSQSSVISYNLSGK